MQFPDRKSLSPRSTAFFDIATLAKIESVVSCETGLMPILKSNAETVKLSSEEVELAMQIGKHIGGQINEKIQIVEKIAEELRSR